MSIKRLGLSESDMDVLADALEADVSELTADLDQRPWSLLDVLEHPAVVTSVLEPSTALTIESSSYLFFAVVTQQASVDLRSNQSVNEWTGPGQRLPVFDVEPLREFIEAPGRVIFIARLLSSFTDPPRLPVPVNALDLEALADWLDVAVPGDRAALYRHLGDLALFRSGVLADETGPIVIDASAAERFGRSLDLTSDEVLEMLDPASFSPGLDVMETLGPSWYRAATDADTDGRLSMVVNDIANRFRPARRFLNHLADHYLNPIDPVVGLPV